jgi:hypothetical protein
MPVIGRLDEQVDDILISPVSKRRRGEQPLQKEEDPAARLDDTPAQTPPKDESSANSGELPVWLL